jgi:hypothetical protein
MPAGFAIAGRLQPTASVVQNRQSANAGQSGIHMLLRQLKLVFSELIYATNTQEETRKLLILLSHL